MNLKKFMMIISVAMMLFVGIGCGKALAFSINVEKGDAYNGYMSTVQETVMVVNNQEIKTQQNTDMNISMNILDVDKDKNVTISYTYDSMKILVDAAGKKTTYDSTQKDSSNPLSAIYSGILGKSFTVKLNNDGNVLEVKGLDDIIMSTIENIPGTEQQKQVVRNALKQSFSDEAIKTMIQQNMSNYPPHNMKVGESWETETNLNVLFPMLVKNNCTLSGEKNGVLNIAVRSTLSVDTQDNPVDIMGQQAKVRLNGEINGNININKKNPILQDGSFTQNISGEMELKIGEKLPITVMVPMKITSTITCKTTKK